MIIAIHQPHYFPWSGYIGKILLADAFVVLDTVQYVKNEWMNRNRIRTSSGWSWLTVPVEYHFPQKISETNIDNKQSWQRKHFRTIQQNYRKALYFDDYVEFLESLYDKTWGSLVTLNQEILEWMMKELKLKQPVYLASKLGVDSEDATERLIKISKKLNASCYLSGSMGREYLKREQFEKAGLELCFQEFTPPTYKQMYPDFIPGLSTLDLLLCQGPERTIELIETGSRRVNT